MRKLNTEYISNFIKDFMYEVAEGEEYLDSKTPIKFICKECSSVFYRRWGNIQNSLNSKCPICSRGDGNANTRKTIDEVKSALKDKDLEVLSESISGVYDKILVRCVRCGIEYNTVVRDAMKSKGCKHCTKYKPHKNKKDVSFVLNLVEGRFDILNIEKYKNMLTKLKFRCKKGHEWETTTKAISLGHGCPACNISKGEQYVRGTLSGFGVYFKEQYSYQDCKYKNVLRFDFYIPNINTLIEVQGTQHYIDTGWFGDSFEDNLKRDQIKRDYCKENNITLIELNYNNSNINKLKSEFEEKVVPLLG
ncbi:MAG: hypothetical protein ACRCX7_07110 [Cetobacterium sp.]|uniref:hypothetical protein n=1 Tax=Cetobacterium sp. TaxID=2071632 RepID=UPI003F4076B1